MDELHDQVSSNGRANFGTAPVFLTAISTILGAVMFLRFGYAVGNVGFVGALGIVLVGHMVTIPTAMAIAEIATNQKVEGGGEYYIISRSFGLTVGAAIGIGLFLSQAISMAFYIIAFAEAFQPVYDWLNASYSLGLADRRLVSVPALLGITVLILRRGADIGVKALYIVVAVLFLSLAMFFAGDSGGGTGATWQTLLHTVEDPAPLSLVFAICFPAFTGMTAGVGLSGDLKEPRVSIPWGTLSATIVGMLVYIAIAYKLAISATPAQLATDQLVMGKIAVWGPIIPIGLACATLSSALGSFLVAPRTLQALAADKVLPWPWVNQWLAAGTGGTNEPTNASLVTAVLGLSFVLLGDVDFVAQIISMFFMVTYGSICTISFLEHFAAEPSYRPSFRSRWYISLFGAMLCLLLMFQMSTLYACVSILVMLVLYLTISRYNEDRRGLSTIAQGAIFQLSRQIQVFLQKSRKAGTDSWRPAIVGFSSSTFQRHAAFDMLRWMAHRYGFGTYIHFIEGYLSRSTYAESREVMSRLVKMSGTTEGNVYVDTIISPSFTSAISQLVQLPGISGKANNMVLFEFSKAQPEGARPIIENYPLLAATGFDVAVLASCERGFGYRQEIHVWIAPSDYENAGLMILLAYILLGHPEWSNAVISIFSMLPEKNIEEEKDKLYRLIHSGRLPISMKNVEIVVLGHGQSRREAIRERSTDAGLIIQGFRGELLKRDKGRVFEGYEDVGNVLFLNTTKELDLLGADEEDQEEVSEEAKQSITVSGRDLDASGTHSVAPRKGEPSLPSRRPETSVPPKRPETGNGNGNGNGSEGSGESD